MDDARVRRMRPGDIPAAVALVDAEGWAFSAEDFGAMLEVEPDGLFVADPGDGDRDGGAGGGGGDGGEGGDLDAAIAGLTTTARYDDVGWIGNVVVAPDRRGRGLGTALVEAAVRHLERDGADTVGLYALPDSMSLYDRLGFVARWEVVYVHAGAPAVGPNDDPDDPGRRIDPPDPGRVAAIDRRHVRPDRSRYLRHLAGRPGAHVLADDHAYLMARPGRVLELGPAVCDPDRPEAFAALLDAALADADGPVEAAFPVANKAAMEAYRDRGLAEGFRATTMTRGPPADADPAEVLYDPAAIFGLLGLETG